MRRLLLCCLWFFPVMLAVGGQGDGMVNRFELMRPLSGTFVEGERGRLVVHRDVFGAARSFPNDVRIFGDDGVQWPFFLHVPNSSEEYSTVDLSVLNKSFVSGNTPYLRFDLEVPAVNGRPQMHNRLELQTSGKDYIRRVEVYTGEGGAEGLLATGYLIDFSRQPDARNRIIRYPDADVPRLQVRIYPNAQVPAESFELRSVKMRHYEEKASEREKVAAVALQLPDREKEEHAQSFLFDLGAENRPAEFVCFKVAGDSYARGVSVYGRNKAHEPWRRAGGGEIHALVGDRDDEVRIRARCRFLKVNVFHYDDRPLDIIDIRIEAVPRYLVFEAASDGAAALYFRAWDLQAPRYDLASRMDKAAIDGLPVAETRATEPNHSAKRQGWRKYSKLLAGLAVGAVSLLVIWIIISMVKQQKLTGEEP